MVRVRPTKDFNLVKRSEVAIIIFFFFIGIYVTIETRTFHRRGDRANQRLVMRSKEIHASLVLA